MTKQERMAGLVFVMFGLAVGIYSFTALKVGSVSQPGPGLFPLICGVGIVLLCLLWLFRSRNAAPASEPLWSEKNWQGPLLAVIIMSVYAALMGEPGYIPSTGAIPIGRQKPVERESWGKTGSVTGIGTVSTYDLVRILLKVALAGGLLGI